MKAEVHTIVIPCASGAAPDIDWINVRIKAVQPVTHVETLLVCAHECDWSTCCARVKQIQGARAIRLGPGTSWRMLVYAGLDQSIGDLIDVAIFASSAEAVGESASLRSLAARGGRLSRGQLNAWLARLHDAPASQAWLPSLLAAIALGGLAFLPAWGSPPSAFCALLAAATVGWALAHARRRMRLGDYQVCEEALFVQSLPGKHGQLNVVWETKA